MNAARAADLDLAARMQGLYSRHAAGLRRHLERLVGSTDADDLVHDVFEKAHRAIPEYRGESNVSTWLYRIATHAALDRLRSRAVRERDDILMRDDADRSHAPPDAELVRARMRACILDLVDALPPGQRVVIMLAELRGLDDRETAEALGITLGAAKIRLHRGRAALKRLVGCECRTYHDEANRLICERIRPVALPPNRQAYRFDPVGRPRR